MRGFPNRWLHLLLAIVVLANVYLAWHGDKHHAELAGQTEQSTAMPTATPAGPEATAEPLDPRERLARAQRLLQGGDSSSAASLLGPLLGADDPGLDAAARLALGRALLADGQAQAALDVLSDLRRRYPSSEVADRAEFFIGLAWEALGDHRQAADSFRSYAERHPEIRAYLELRAASNLRQAGELDQAAALAESVAGQAPIRRTAVAALELVRVIAQQHGDHAGLVQVTSRLLELATLRLYRAELIYAQATAQRALGQVDVAAAGFLAVVTGAPDSPYAAPSLAALDELGRGDAVLREQRGLVYLNSGQYAAAIEAFSQALAINPGSDLAWYYRALARLRSGDTNDSAQELASLAEQFPASPFAAEALLTAAKLYEHDRRFAEARLAYQRVLDQFPGTPQASEARFRLGLLAYMEGDLPGAERRWREATTDADDSARASFWLGKALEAAGNRDGATEAWEAARRQDPTGFYGLRAAELLAGHREVRAAPATLEPEALEGTPSEEQELARWFSELGSDLDVARGQVEADPGYRRVRELLDLGLRTEAGWQVDALLEQYAGNPAALASLAVLLGEQGEVAYAYRAASRLQAASGASALPRTLERLLYPIPYPDLLLPRASAREIDPLLLAALIRQESAFEPQARSPADARGLTQVLPSTGQGIADALGRANWQPDDLYRPAVSIEFGAFYLAQRLAAYDNQLYPALAGYNAGDGNARAWVSRFGLGDPDLFIERIPFPETHDYVQRVYANYLTYQRLYRSPSP
jgi:soluble lytic murein transglycosylase